MNTMTIVREKHSYKGDLLNKPAITSLKSECPVQQFIHVFLILKKGNKRHISVKTHDSIDSKININNNKYALYDFKKQRKTKFEEQF